MNALEIVIQSAEKLANPDYVLSCSSRLENTFLNGSQHPWHPLSLDFGYPALMILFSEIDRVFPSKIWKNACKKYATGLLNALMTNGYSSLSLSSGLTGASFAAYIAFQNDPSYQLLHQKLHNLLLAKLKEISLPDLRISSYLDCDLMCGICGFLSYLYHFSHQEDEQDLIKRFLSFIIQTCGFIETPAGKVPAWLNSPASYAKLPQELSDELESLYPNGFFDTGLAHGVAGYLAALARGLSCGFKLPNQEEAMDNVCNWLKESRQEVSTVSEVWPRRFSFHTTNHSLIHKCDFYFDGMGYGAPGIYNSIRLAASSLINKNLLAFCTTEFNKQLPRIQNIEFNDQLSLCYGASGILSIANQFASANKSIELDVFRKNVEKKIINRYDPTLPFGFKCVPLARKPFEASPIDNFGLISGVAGILLSLLTAHTNSRTLWTSMFLLN